MINILLKYLKKSLSFIIFITSVLLILFFIYLLYNDLIITNNIYHIQGTVIDNNYIILDNEYYSSLNISFNFNNDIKILKINDVFEKKYNIYDKINLYYDSHNNKLLKFYQKYIKYILLIFIIILSIFLYYNFYLSNNNIIIDNDVFNLIENSLNNNIVEDK